MKFPFFGARQQLGRASLSLVLLLVAACKGTGEESVVRAREHAKELADTAQRDAAELRRGLPLGAQQLGQRWAAGGADLVNDPEAARDALNYARNKVQDLRIAKSTFFALVAPDGRIVRNDREQDLMSGVSLFATFPALQGAARGPYVEALGVMPEAHGVRGKPDAEWMAAVGVDVGGQVRGLYVSGWAWSSYAFRLEFSLRNRITTELRGKRENVPLLYAFVVVGNAVYGTPESPEVNARAIAALEPLAHLGPDGSFSTLLVITERDFALAVQAAPGLAEGVGIGVLRSEI